VIVRLVLAVALTTALIATALVPLGDARRERASAVVAEQASAIERHGGALLASDDPIDGPGARRTVTLGLPTRTWTSAPVDRLTVQPASDAKPASISWRVAGEQTHVRHLPGVPLASVDGTPLVIRGTGTHRLTLALDGHADEPVVTVRRLK